ncbi:aminotransferase class I/II-fold pyridoxal phosphate-dependent enzyme [Microbacterium sp. BWT-B31]|uniref:O-acetylhomoserine aminocarboxypropyltransferase/cysteine synthase family protein n=1 Tax=Microbacterium sp. BWT-B31 TaxID=3232072 RepID=UPI00352967E4
MHIDERELGFATRQLHAGKAGDDTHGARATPIYLTAGFEFEGLDDGRARFDGTSDGYSYTRVANPTNAAVERRIAALEGGAGALLVSTGQAATTTAVLALAAAGDHIVSSAHAYEGTRELLRDNLGRLGITVDFVADTRNPDAWAAAIRPETRLVFAESIANPRNQVLDVRLVADVAHRHGLPLVIDNTLASPFLLRPIEHGADVVVHSASKFLAGHGTVLGGVVVDGGWFDWASSAGRYPQLTEQRGADGRTPVERSGSNALLDYARSVAMRFGPAPSPLNAFLILQGVETLSLRVRQHSASALEIARWLAAQPGVESVDYSGLASHPDHDLAVRYLPDGFGSVFSFTLRGGLAAADAFTRALRLFTHMTHLGDSRSLVLHPGTTTHALRTDDERDAAGIGPGLLRLSIGLEDAPDLIADLANALEAVAAAIPGFVDGPPAAPAGGVPADAVAEAAA